MNDDWKTPRAQKRLAREIRAARAYSGKDRDEFKADVGLGKDQFGRYERGDWKRSPSPALLAAIARACDVPQAWLDAGFLAPEDPAKRFAESVEREAERQREHPASTEEARPDEGVERANH